MNEMLLLYFNFNIVIYKLNHAYCQSEQHNYLDTHIKKRYPRVVIQDTDVNS